MLEFHAPVEEQSWLILDMRVHQFAITLDYIFSFQIESGKRLKIQLISQHKRLLYNLKSELQDTRKTSRLELNTSRYPTINSKTPLPPHKHRLMPVLALINFNHHSKSSGDEAAPSAMARGTPRTFTAVFHCSATFDPRNLT